MTLEQQLSDSHKFNIPLQSRTERKRILEAKEKLSGIYPFELSETNIFILKTEKKGFFDIYVSNNQFEKPLHIKKDILLAILLLIIAGISICLIRYFIKTGEESIQIQKEIAQQEAEAKKLQKEKEIKLEKLKTQYSQIQAEKYEKIYPYIERIYVAMGNDSTIENISIDKSTFSVEATTKDAMKVLQRFEENEAFSSIKMNKTTVNGNKDKVTYSGVFSRFWKDENPSVYIEENIDFYEKEIAGFQERRKQQSELSISEYITGIRNILHTNKCNEQYIQIRGSKESTEVEFFILSTSRNILRFLYEIQNENNNLIDIKQLRIRNSEIADKVQTTICFDSGIELKNENDQVYEYQDTKISAEEINKIFYKTPVARPSEKKVYNTMAGEKSKKQETKKIPANFKKLSFIGFTRMNGTSFAIVKDEEMGSIYKLPSVQSETEGDFFIEEQNGYKAKIRGLYYEVKK